MHLRVKNLTVAALPGDPDQRAKEELLRRFGLDQSECHWLRIRKKSLDARKKNNVVYHYQFEFSSVKDEALLAHFADLERIDEEVTPRPFEGRVTAPPLKPVIVGSGPSGIFCALVLAESGVPSIILERGFPVEKRLRHVNALRRGEAFHDESNYCYGEGGAGTFSDGKLSCGRNHPLIRYLFDEWVRFGAPEEILYDAHPHIGTDFLMVIAKRMRDHLEDLGCEFHFETRVDDIEYRPDGSAKYQLRTADDRIFESNHLILAIGHSARETYHMLLGRGLAMAPKPFAIGARFEHPQELINKIQFGQVPLDQSAEYKLVAHAADRGIWTFCMCPGGHLLPTGAKQGHLAINGMSYHARNSGFANAAVVVNVQREDFFRGHTLDGVYFQEAIEKAAFAAGGGNYHAPGQRMQDFIAGKLSKDLAPTTYKPGVTSARLDQVLPDFVVNSLRIALVDYNKKMHGYLSRDGMVVGVETKTSSPVVMMRDKQSFESVSHPGFYPTGEGAGFAGGIVSASLDGVRVAQAILQSLPSV